MNKKCNKANPPTKIGQNVNVTIPASQNTKGSFQNVVTVTLSRSEDGMYKLGTQVLVPYLQTKFNNITDDTKGKEKSFRYTATLSMSAVGSGEGYIKGTI